MQINQAELDRRLGSSKNLVNTLPDKGPALPSRESVEQVPPFGSDYGNFDDLRSPFLEEQVDPSTPRTKLGDGIRIVAGSLAYQMPAKEVAEGLGITVAQVQSAKHSKNENIR